jgi:hypothetical protein
MKYLMILMDLQSKYKLLLKQKLLILIIIKIIIGIKNALFAELFGLKLKDVIVCLVEEELN